MTNPTPEQIEAALGYIDKTIDNCQDLPPDLKWGNLEVLGMLGQVRAELLAAAGVTPQPEGLLERIADTLAYYQCRETNPKADHPRMGYHAFSEEQRAHLREQKAEAAAEIARMMGAGVTPQEPPRTAAPTAKVILRGSDSDCASGVCPKGCSHLMWFCDQCSCEGGWGGTEEFLEALAVQHICPDLAAPQAPTRERCGDCGDKLEYVAGLDGEGCYPHCWRCWYKDRPVELPSQVDKAKLAEILKKHRQAVYEWAEGDGCLCGVALQGDGGLKPGPEEVAEHISSVVAEWLRGGGQ